MIIRNCAGGIVFCGDKVLLLRNDKHEWVFPKGVVRAGQKEKDQYDGNPLTSAGGKKNITLTLKSPQRVEAVRLMAVHENNVINAGDQYLLLFWNGKEWATCGEKTAEY